MAEPEAEVEEPEKKDAQSEEEEEAVPPRWRHASKLERRMFHTYLFVRDVRTRTLSHNLSLKRRSDLDSRRDAAR